MFHYEKNYKKDLTLSHDTKKLNKKFKNPSHKLLLFKEIL